MKSGLRIAAETGLVWMGLALLLPCLYYPYAGPRAHGDFLLNDADWRVISGPDCASGAPCLEAGDRVLSIGGVTADAFRRDRSLSMASLFGPGRSARVEIERDGRRLGFDMAFAPGEAPPALALLSHVSPLLFLAAGLLAALWLRPRDEPWWVLVLLFYDIALWLAAGFGQRVGGAALIFHSTIWWFAPLALHLHLILPQPLLGERALRRTLVALYGLALAGNVLDLTNLLPSRAYLLAFTVAVLGSVGLLLLHLRRRREPAVRAMAFGVGFSLLPFAATYVLVPALVLAGSVSLETVNRWSPYLAMLSLLALPTLPGGYLAAIDRRRLGDLEIRASRWAGSYVFAGLIGVGVIVGAFLLARAVPGLGGRVALLVLALVTALVWAASALRRPIQRFVERRVFGIRHAPDEIVSLVAARAPGAFDHRLLSELLADEVLPALLVRESALALIGEQPELLYARGVAAPSAAVVAAWAARCRALTEPLTVDPGQEPRATGMEWVRLVVPLRVRDRPLGIWLLGRRDPDDRYPADDARLLATVANQVAPMFENVRLFEATLRSGKMEAVGRLSAGIAHDFNNTLLAVFSQIDLLRETRAGDAELQTELAEMRSAAERAADLTRRLLAFARRQPMQPRPVDPNAIVEGMRSMVERTLGSGVRVSVELEPGLPPVEVDPGPIEQVLLNLAVNACDAMPAGGELAIRTRRVEVRNGLELGQPDLRPGGYLALEVADTGRGMEPETLARVFEPFFTTKSEGTGLGLATAYGVVRQSGGHIAARSRVGEGTAFTVYLPLLEGENAPLSPQGAPELALRRSAEREAGHEAASAPGGGRTVLLVEDEHLGRRALTQILERAGYRVVAAGSGEEALELAAADSDLDVLVTDVQMSGIPGTELADRLRASRPGLKVVFMTGHDDSRLGGRAALLKPFSRQALLAAIEVAR